MRSAGVVLAGGSSVRMGMPKQLLEVGGRPMLEVIVANACASRLDEVVVVLGAAANQIRALIRQRPEMVATLPGSGGHRHPVDVDTPQDYERLVHQRISG